MKRRTANHFAETSTITEPEIKLPIAEQTEIGTLGLLLLEKDAMAKAIEAGLTPDHFGIESNKVIYGAMLHFYLNGNEIHPNTLTDYLRTQHKLDRVGGPAYLSTLIDGRAPGLTMLGGLIDQLNTARFKRVALKNANEIMKRASNGASVSDIRELIESFEESDAMPQRYAATSRGLVWKRVRQGIIEPELLSNFTARIVSEQIEDDGSLDGETRIFEIEAELKGCKRLVRVPAAKFATMTWPTQLLGAEAILMPGKEPHARAAIQSLSRGIRQMTVYTHTGWREIDGVWSFLHTGGAITPTENRLDVSVRLPESLRYFHFPTVPDEANKAEAFLSPLSLMKAFPANVTVPLLGGVFASVLGSVDYSIFVTGQSGTKKSELTALAQSFFGSGFNRLALPSSFVDSPLAIMLKAFKAKDAVLVVDDFAPNGDKRHDDKIHNTAETIFRAAGNAAGRSTAKVDHSERGAKPPRGLLISSGEDVPRGLSLQNRLLIVPLKLGDIENDVLSQMQAMAREGKFAESMAVFIQHVAKYKTTIDRIFKADCLRYRKLISEANKQHARQPTTMAHLCAAWRAWLRAGVAIGAFSRPEARAIWKNVYRAITATIEGQKEQHTTTHPADYFVELLRSALLSGRCHLATIEGNEPETRSNLYGWRKNQPMGDLAGWIEDGFIYLEPSAAFKAANMQGASIGEQLPVGQKSLWTRLDEKKYIVLKENNRGLRARTPRTRLYSVVIAETLLFD